MTGLSLKTKEMGGDTYYIYSFDLTTIGSAVKWQKIIDHHNLAEYDEQTIESVNGEKITDFLFFDPEKENFIKTGNHPISGRFRKPDGGRIDKGYCSYIAFAFRDREKLKAVVYDILTKAEHVKAAGQGFCGVHPRNLEGVGVIE